LRRFTDAEQFYREAMTIAADLDTPAERCAVLRRRGLLCQMQQYYCDALDFWVQALVLDQRLGHPVRQELQSRVSALVTEQHLEISIMSYVYGTVITQIEP